MENLKKIKLFGNRDFSENFDMTLSFVKQNYIPILKGLLILAPIYLIIAYFMPNTASLSAGSYSGSLSFFSFGFLAAYLLTILVSVSAMLYVISYIALYAKSADGIIKSSDVWIKVSKIFLPALGISILFGIMATVGVIIFIIPGIIIYVYFGFYCYIYANEEINAINTFQRSYELVKNNWWVTFGYGLVFLIVVAIMSVIFNIPSHLISLGIAFDIKIFTSDVYVYIATFIGQIGSFLLYPILYIAMGVMYYSHRNRMEGIDVEDEIDNIGISKNEGTDQI